MYEYCVHKFEYLTVVRAVRLINSLLSYFLMEFPLVASAFVYQEPFVCHVIIPYISIVRQNCFTSASENLIIMCRHSRDPEAIAF